MKDLPAVENEPVRPSRGKIIVNLIAVVFLWFFMRGTSELFGFASAGYYISMFFLALIYINLFFWAIRKPSERLTFRSLFKQIGAVVLGLLLVHSIHTFLFPTIQILSNPIETPFGTSEALGGIIVVLMVLSILGLGFYAIESSIKK